MATNVSTTSFNPVFDDSNAFFNVLFSFFSELRFQSPQAIDLAMRAGALMVTRHGTADVIPDLKEIRDHDFRS